MSELKNVGILINSLKMPDQTYEHLISFFDIYNDPNKIQEVINDKRFDLCGFLPKGFWFKNKRTIEKIVNTFNSGPKNIAFLICPPLVDKKCPYFINKKIIKIDRPIQNLSDMLFFVEQRGLEAKEAMEELFIYEH